MLVVKSFEYFFKKNFCANAFVADICYFEFDIAPYRKVRSVWIFEIRLLFSRLKLALLCYTRVRRTLTSHLGRGSFVLIV